ncbi:MAG: DUF4304 domain-containing protein [Eubacteriales bacterium]|nr:DUF4304 domain-containing protein [Clostridiales bacterium]MDD7595151.1 DUF4304 domain-containing protein [Clostridiales bacterium]MDY4886102.1 DUF4304 domain-containing protein [Eubacteriales bacterium]MDY5859932.1 DUF4304 domain-containing protein [Eubacteriales bacterium]HCG67137.1 hypothetical protein [Clostridiales bacterium]
MKHVLPEEQLIEYAKSYLKAKGFKKKNKRWTKDTGEFTLCFYIQGSSYSKEDYYIRPGIFINALMPCDDVYGHFMLEIEPSTPEEVVSKFDDWCEEWTNKSLIKERLIAFMEWDKRNPLEKRRAGLVDYDADPVPSREFFATTLVVKQFILDNF